MFGNFTQVPNEIIIDKRISPAAKLFWIYIQMKPDNWTFYDRNISAELDVTSDTLRRYRVELKELGYMLYSTRVKANSAIDGVDYFLFNKSGDRTEEALSLGILEEMEDGMVRLSAPPLKNKGTTPQKQGVRTPLKVRGLNNTNTNTNTIVTDKSDDAIPAIKEVSETMKDAIAVATLLADSLRDSIGNFKYPTEAGLLKWAKDIDLAIRLDKRTLNGLKNIIG